ncbi:MAG: type VI secretion system baseplate subunit TssK [Pseudomonadota bacterium]
MNSRRSDALDPTTWPDAVQWYEGMMLAPQHFQQQAAHTDALIAHAMHTTSAFPWGVRKLEIDHELLASTGRFQVNRLEAVFPDGLVFSSISESGEPPTADMLALDLLDSSYSLDEHPVYVHIKVARQSEDAAHAGHVRRRYASINGDLVKDQNLGDNPISVPRLRPAPSLIVTELLDVGIDATHVSVPIACVHLNEGRLEVIDARGGEGDQGVSARAFQPPLLNVARGWPIHEEARAVRGTLRDAADKLISRLKAAEGGDAIEGAEARHTLRAVTAHLMRLEVELEQGVIAPYDLYLLLCDVVSSVSTLDLEHALPKLGAYDHKNAYPQFRTIRQIVESRLSYLDRDYDLSSFDYSDDGVFTHLLEGALLGEHCYVLLVLQSGAALSAAREWLQQSIVVSGRQLAAARVNRIRGAARAEVKTVRGLAFDPPTNMLLVEIAGDPSFRERDASLQIVHPNGSGQAGEPVRIQLLKPRVGARV